MEIISRDVTSAFIALHAVRGNVEEIKYDDR